MKNIKLTIEYDGTNYHGWQSQVNAVSVQGVLTDAVRKATGEECNIIGASRTDAGVHALGQTANFWTESPIPPDKFTFVLNTILPSDIVVKRSEEVSPDFHSQYWARGKKYRYLIYNSQHPSALLRNRAWHVPVRLDLDAMRRAAECFLGEHDFSAFRAAGSSVKTSTRTISAVSVDRRGEEIALEIQGDGFLYNMVRIIAGTLAMVGSGKISASDIPGIIQSRDRTLAGQTAPPHGLYLVEVFYGE